MPSSSLRDMDFANGGWQGRLLLTTVRTGRTSGRNPHLGPNELLLRTTCIPKGSRSHHLYTVVERRPLTVYYTLSEGGYWIWCQMWPDVYLRSIKTGRMGGVGPRFAAIRIEHGWTYDAELKRLYYSPWRYR